MNGQTIPATEFLHRIIGRRLLRVFPHDKSEKETVIAINPFLYLPSISYFVILTERLCQLNSVLTFTLTNGYENGNWDIKRCGDPCAKEIRISARIEWIEPRCVGRERYAGVWVLCKLITVTWFLGTLTYYGKYVLRFLQALSQKPVSFTC